MAALDVYVQIGMQLDSNTLATDVIPALWGLALGPLLNLEQVCSSLSSHRTVSDRIVSIFHENDQDAV